MLLSADTLSRLTKRLQLSTEMCVLVSTSASFTVKLVSRSVSAPTFSPMPRTYGSTPKFTSVNATETITPIVLRFQIETASNVRKPFTSSTPSTVMASSLPIKFRSTTPESSSAPMESW